MTTEQKVGRGGKRVGAGRKPSANLASKLATVKMTPEEHRTFLKVGGSRWLKQLLGATSNGDDQATAGLIANFLRQLSGTDWDGKDLAELASAVESGERKVRFDPDF